MAVAATSTSRSAPARDRAGARDGQDGHASGRDLREAAVQLPRAFAARERMARDEMLGAPLRWPRPSRLEAPLAPPSARAGAALRALGIECVGDLLEHLPRDRRALLPVAALRAGEQATVAVEVRSIRAAMPRRAGAHGPRSVVEARVFDASGSIRVAFYNQPWLVRRYPPGARLLLHGKVDRGGRLQVWSHALERDGEGEPGAAHERLIAPEGAAEGISHYPVAEGVTSTQVASLVRSSRVALGDVREALPGRMRATERLPLRAEALAAAHFSADHGAEEVARRRLAFEEVLIGQLMLLMRRARRRARGGGHRLAAPPRASARWLEEGLPFAPTADQRRAAGEIDVDIACEAPMQRLLVGEVGSGKTVVALYAMLRALEHGHQAALMAPTETLAEQHHATCARLLGEHAAAPALLTGSTGAARRRAILAALADGETGLVVGTHALIEPDVRFRSLAVAVVDEQHRFGVRQRVALDRKGAAGRLPHVLHMTATPIPRTLALLHYGDLDVSTLRELPRGRGSLRTRIAAGETARRRAYATLREHLDAGRQGYVVCPLVDEPEEGAVGTGLAAPGRAATAELERLARGELAGYRLRLLHGQMSAAEKQAAMAAFVAGAADVLVCTTVVEVGVDVPNATVMLVEGAERFGISQLHQLRGRVGRGAHASECFLVCPAEGAGTRRLRALARSSDGFRLAELDLRLRGAGELAGTRQSGAQAFRFARLPDDAALLERARAWARTILERDPQLRQPEHAPLADALLRSAGGEALAPIPA